MPEWLDRLDQRMKEKLVKAEMPEKVEPMLATLTHEYFSDPNWIYERKLDGERCLLFKENNRVNLYSRNKKKLNNSYPEIVEAVGSLDHDMVMDGEVVAFDGDVTSFSRLQGRMKVTDPAQARLSGIKVYYYVFDLLYLDGYDLTRLELLERKRLLKEVGTYLDPLRYCRHLEEEGEKYLNEACKNGWEGIIAKRADSPYVHKRSRDWLKFKCVNEQEFVVGGFTDPHGQRVGFGALLVGYFRDNRLEYAGKVGTGYDEQTLKELHHKMTAIEIDSSPFSVDITEKGVHWLRPELVAQIGFTEWTEYGKLRHPRFLGLRRDKPAREVVREDAQ